MERLKTLRHALRAGWTVFHQVWTFLRGMNIKPGMRIEKLTVTHVIDFDA